MHVGPYSVSPTAIKATRHASFVLLFYSVLFTIFFSPVLFHNSLLAPGDGLLYHVSYFQSKKVFWDTLLSSGFPMTADPQVMAWYPPALLLSLLPDMWNVFVISAFVMASCFTYGYVYTLTESKLASLVSGIAYGMCGFMIAHLGHTAIIHVAAWPPLIIWSLEKLRRKFSPSWFAVGCLAVACCVLAGHLQIVVYGLLLSVCYAAALGWQAPAGRKRYYLVSFVLLLLGLGLAALQIIPTAELTNLSARAAYSYSDFATYSLPLNQVVSLIFPAAFGGLQQYGATPYFRAWNLTELTGYVGLLPLMLAAVGFAVSRRSVIAVFWISVAVIAFLLTLGDMTPLAYLTYHLPLLGKFRAPARHFVEMALAVSVLAGLGVQAIVRLNVTKRLLVKTVSGSALFMLAGLLYLVSKHSTEYTVDGRTIRLNASPWSNPAVGVPLLIFVVTCLALWYWYRSPDSLLRKTSLLTILIVGTASFGWFYEWRTAAPSKDMLEAPAFAANYGKSLQATYQRALPIRGTRGTTSEIPPNLSRVWNVPSASAYGPLSLSRVSNLLSMRADSSLDPSWKNANNQSLNVLAVRYVLLSRTGPAQTVHGVLWNTENMGAWLGGGCDQPQNKSITFNLSTPVRATTLGIVSRLACSVGVPEGAEVVGVSLTGTDGSVQTQSLLAGRDTSEWAYDCRTVKTEMKHKQASVYSSFPSEMNAEPCEGHFYVTMLDLNGVKDIRSVELRWMGNSEAISIEKVTLIDKLANTSEPINSLSANSDRWGFVGEEGQAHVYENLDAMPRAWIVPEVVSLNPEEILLTIKTSKLPDGRAYDPSRIALVETPITLTKSGRDAGANEEVTDIGTKAEVVLLTDTEMEVRTTSASPAFLVTSDAYYPGWHASIDGAPIEILRTNYALRGVQVPAGNHLVRFDFTPKSFYYGAAIGGLSMLILIGVLWRLSMWRLNFRRERST